MKKFLIGCVFGMMALTNYAAVMTFDNGVSEPRFVFNRAAAYDPSTQSIHFTETGSSMSIFVTNSTYNLKSFKISGSGDYQITDSQSLTQNFNASDGIVILNWTNIRGIYINIVNGTPNLFIDDIEYCSNSLIQGNLTTSANGICSGTAVTLTASEYIIKGTQATLTWWTGANGTGTNLGTSNPLVHSPTANTTYYARLAGDCNEVEAAISVTVHSKSAITSVTASSTEVCLGNADTLTPVGLIVGSGATLNWFTGPNGGGTLLGTSNPLIHAPIANTTYYARLAGTCDTVETSTSVTVNSVPVISNITSSRNPSINGYAPYQCTDLTVFATGTGILNYNWTNNATDSITNVCPTQETTYNVIVTDGNGCRTNGQIFQSVTQAVSPYPGRVIMCYNYRGRRMNIHVASNTVPQYLGAGAYFGECLIRKKQNFAPEFDNSYSIYPNPAQNQITTEWFNLFNEMVTIELVDMTGRVVATIFKGEVVEGEMSLINTDVSNLPTGMYLMRYSSDTDVRVNKLQIVR